MDYTLIVKCETLKHLGEKNEKNLQDLRIGKDFLDLTSKAQSIKGKTCKWTSFTINISQ